MQLFLECYRTSCAHRACSHGGSSLEGQVVTSQASIDEQTKLSKPEEGTSQSALSVVLGLGSVSKSVNDSSNRPHDTKGRAEQGVAEATDEEGGEGHVVVLEVVTVGALDMTSQRMSFQKFKSNLPERS
jgi:hypothetical protein